MELLSIESNFLSLSNVKDKLNLVEIKRVQKSISNAHKTKFNHTLKMSGLITEAVKFFESTEGMELFAEEGIQWSKAEFGSKVFGYQKSFFYKMLKAGNLDSRILEAFNSKCDSIGDDANRSLAGLLDFSRTIDLDNLDVSEDATEEEIANAETEAIESASVESERINYTFVMTYKNPTGANLSIRIDDQGNVAGNNFEEIANAITFLQNAVNNNQ